MVFVTGTFSNSVTVWRSWRSLSLLLLHILAFAPPPSSGYMYVCVHPSVKVSNLSGSVLPTRTLPCLDNFALYLQSNVLIFLYTTQCVYWSTVCISSYPGLHLKITGFTLRSLHTTTTHVLTLRSPSISECIPAPSSFSSAILRGFLLCPQSHPQISIVPP